MKKTRIVDVTPLNEQSGAMKKNTWTNNIIHKPKNQFKIYNANKNFNWWELN